MQNAEIARQFEELADLLEIQGANPFRLRAYRNAARTISGLPDSIQEIVHNDPKELQELPGIGKDLAEKIQTIVESSTLPQLEELKEQIPPDVVRMLDIPGIGPKKVAFLFSELNIHSLDDLKAAAENGVIAEQKGRPCANGDRYRCVIPIPLRLRAVCGRRRCVGRAYRVSNQSR